MVEYYCKACEGKECKLTIQEKPERVPYICPVEAVRACRWVDVKDDKTISLLDFVKEYDVQVFDSYSVMVANTYPKFGPEDVECQVNGQISIIAYDGVDVFELVYSYDVERQKHEYSTEYIPYNVKLIKVINMSFTLSEYAKSCYGLTLCGIDE